MPRLTNSNPSYRRHRASGQAVVTIDGRDAYLGPHGTKASRAEYDRVIGEWLANGRRSPVASVDLTVAEVAARFWAHAQQYYVRPDGTQTGEAEMFRLAMRPLVRLYGRHPARDFGPLSLEAVRGEMVRSGMARTYVNAQVRRVRMVFRWGVAKELVPPSVLHGLAAVAGLRAGRSGVRESEPVRPVADATVEQTLPHLSPTVAALVRVQLLSGARPGEICAIRTVDVDRSSDVWTVIPSSHKTAHHGHGRTIHLGPQAQAVLLPFLNLADPSAPLFSPAAAETARRAARSAARVTPLSCGNRPRNDNGKGRQRPPGEQYGVREYRRAIARACDAAFPPPPELARRPGESAARWRDRLTPDQRATLARWQTDHRWHPHQLRHSAATTIRKRFGVERAGTVLGHRTLATTLLYAERDADAARAVAAAIG